LAKRQEKGVVVLGRLFLLFTVVPAIELYLLIQIGNVIGAFTTFAIILLTGAVGAHLARREGTRVWFSVQQQLSQGALPGDQLIEALLILIAGALLITPGFLTDIFGFSLLIPPLRLIAVKSLKERFSGSINIHPGPMSGPGPGLGPGNFGGGPE
jgi:UPF0716 protein FxsA